MHKVYQPLNAWPKAKVKTFLYSKLRRMGMKEAKNGGEGGRKGKCMNSQSLQCCWTCLPGWIALPKQMWIYKIKGIINI